MANVIVAGRQFATGGEYTVGLAASVKSPLIAASVLTAVNSAVLGTQCNHRRATLVPAARFLRLLRIPNAGRLWSPAIAFLNQALSVLYGFSGRSCEAPPDLCTSAGRAAAELDHLIAALTVFFSQPVDPTCICSNGYTGQFAIFHRTATPTPIVCGNHGFCAEGACVCTNRYTGDRCEVAPGATLLVSGEPTEVQLMQAEEGTFRVRCCRWRFV